MSEKQLRAELLQEEIREAVTAVRVAIDACRSPATHGVLRAVERWVTVVSRAVESYATSASTTTAAPSA